MFRALEKEKQLLLPLSYKLSKDPNDLNINIHEVEAILLLFQQTWAWCWHHYHIIIHTNNSTTCSGLFNLTLQGPVNTLLQEVFLIVAK